MCVCVRDVPKRGHHTVVFLTVHLMLMSTAIKANRQYQSKMRSDFHKM